MQNRFTPLVQSLPASVPFVGPETLQRQSGQVFAARIGANESAFGLSPAALSAMHDALGIEGCSWYGDPENHELRTVLADVHGVHMDEICVDAGIDSLLGLTVRMMMNPGDTVVTSDGAYPTFNYHVSGFGGRLEKIPYQDYHEDVQALIYKSRQCNARLVYLSNPDNPMGTWHGADAIQAAINELPENTTLLVDEAYIEFAPDGTAPAIDTSNPNVIRYRTFSKAYGMAGMRIGYAIANKSIITAFNKVRNHFAVNRLAQIAALASLNDTGFLGSVNSEVQAARQRVYALCNELSLPYLDSATNFVSVDIGDSDKAGALLGQLNDNGVFMRMPAVKPLNRFIRVGLGTAEEHEVFAGVLRNLRPPSA